MARPTPLQSSPRQATLAAVTPMTAWAVLCWIAFAAVASSLSGQERCEYRDDVALDLAAGSLDELDIEAGSGELVVEGRSGLEQITVEATLCASSQDRLDALRVELDRSGSRGILRTDFPDWNDGGWGDRYARIDLRVELPASLTVHVDDGSGWTQVTGVAGLFIDDGSGGIDIQDIAGDVEIEDGSGEVHVRGVQGDLRIDDGSGELELDDVTGSIYLSDGSGSVDIRRVGQNVIVDDKGSGMIDVADVGGDLRVDGTRRERIRYRDVQGAVDLPPERRRRGRRGGR